MKVGITYLYTIFKYGYPPDIKNLFRSLEDIHRMGFHYLEMEGLGPQHILELWKYKEELKKCLDDLEIHVHNFCGVDPDLVSADDRIRKESYDNFKIVAEMAAFFGAETLHLASYAPPVTYPDGTPYALNATYKFEDVIRLEIPDGFSWQRVWDVLVESCRFSAEVAARYEKIIIMEPRIGEIICSPDSMIRLIKDVGYDNFKANFDTGHFSAQRENIPLALMKLAGLYANIHIADNNPKNTDHLPLGLGVIDWREFFRILKKQDYNGYIGLDLGRSESIIDDLRSSLAYMLSIADELDLDLIY